jgi:hypothetical protein
MKKVAMLQPNYIPWKGVFDLISRVDVFVFYDDVQYTKRDWRNRNKIKTKDGELWLTVPVNAHRGQLICEVEIDQSSDWQMNHFKTIKNSYAKAPYFKDYEFLLEEIYLKTKWSKISELDIFATKLIASKLGLSPEWVLASDLRIEGNKDGEKIINICKKLGCNYFINGPAAKAFMDEDKFKEAGIELDYIEYSYPEYSQMHGDFIHGVSVLDTLFNCGPDSSRFILKKNVSL